MKRAIGIAFTITVLLASNALSQNRQLTTPDTGAERRVALVIGNGSYGFSPLKNPVNDAQDMAQTLRDLNFEVIYGVNLNQNEMKRLIRNFGEKLRGSDIGLFYYAGHGVQVGGANYLVPLGTDIQNEEEVEYECVDVGFVLAQMSSAKNGMNIVVLDACRNNPFSRRYRSVDRGLASINAPSGTFIAYATTPGSVADDGDQRNGVYTSELLTALRIPGLKLEDIFKQVRRAVRRKTAGKQVPWESSSVDGDFYFIKTNEAVKSSQVQPQNNTSSSKTVAANEYGDRLEVISISPSDSSRILLGQTVTVRIAYQLNSSDTCLIWARPVSKGDYSFDSSIEIPRGSGIIEKSFLFSSQDEISLVEILMRTGDNSRQLLSLRVKYKAYFVKN